MIQLIDNPIKEKDEFKIFATVINQIQTSSNSNLLDQFLLQISPDEKTIIKDLLSTQRVMISEIESNIPRRIVHIKRNQN